MEFDLKYFAEILWQKNSRSDMDLPVVSGYVLKYIFQPLRRGEKIRFRDLNFDAFDAIDLQDLNELLEVYSRMEDDLIRLSEKFCRIPPCAVAHSAFC